MKTTKTRFLCATFALVGLTSSLLVSSEADAGNWSSQTLGQTPPMWFDYRASVNDNGVIAASRMLGTTATEPIVSESDTTVTVLPTPTMITPDHLANLLPAVTQGAAMDVSPDGRVVGFRAGVNPAQRQALYWAKEGASWISGELHDAVLAQFPRYAVSSAYGISALTSANQYFAVGYIREWIQPSSLSEPAIWTINTISNKSTVTKLPLPSLTPAPGAGQGTYGIANAVSELDRANRRVACGGAGVSTSYIYAQCWDVTNAASPSLITTPSVLIASSGVATSVVNRVRTIDLGGTGTDEWNGRQNIAVGYMTYTSGATAGFVWNLTTGSFDIHTALGSSYDSILSDVTKQSFTQSASRQNAASGAIYHGPLVVGTSSTTTSPIAPTSPLPDQTPATVRGVYQARLDAIRDNAPEATTCDMDSQLPSLGQTLAMISGISRDGMRMVGDAGGQLVRMTNALTSATINLYQRNARIYTGPATANYTTQSYHWATVSGHSNARVMWSNAAGCDVFQTGLACPAALSGPLAQTSAVGARRDGALATAWTYVQAHNLGGTACNMTPVYAVADLNVVTNPSSDTTGATEQWADCSSAHSNDPRWDLRVGVAGGHNVDLRRDFYHCGACNLSSDDARTCTTDSCVNGVRQHSASGVGCWIGGTTTSFGSGTCYANNQRKPETYGLNPCQRCQQTNPATWSNFGSSTCCNNGTPVLDAHDNAGGGSLPDRNNGNGANARTVFAGKDDNGNWSTHDRWCCGGTDSWGSCKGWCDHAVACNANVGNESARFNPDIDLVDWYQFYAEDNRGLAGVDTNGNPEPRVRVILQDNFTAEVCVYGVCERAGTYRVNAGDLIARQGTWGTAHLAPAGSPAVRGGVQGRGRCATISGNGAAADMEVHLAQGCGPGTTETDHSGWLVWSVRAVNASALECGLTDYKMRWGNDQQNGHYSDGAGCLTCCN